MMGSSFLFLYIACVVVRLHGQIPNIDEENDLVMNSTSILEILKPQNNPYLQELSGHWTFNDTIDISKYEEFDHTRFESSREMSLEDLIAKVKEHAKTKSHPNAGGSMTTSPPEDLPVFDSNLVTNSTAQLGATAFLHCRVRNLNNRAVSWVRRKDWHILTSAMLTYTNDERFQVLHTEGSEDWTLQIKYVQKSDNGAYECQVATGRGTISHYFNLIVVIPTAYILGTGEYHIGQGSTISLVCIIENSPIPPQYIMWYHNDNMINHEVGAIEDGRIQVLTETPGEKTHSRLLITDATPSHSGNYTCTATNTEPDSVYVFVSTGSYGDNIAAIQRQDASGSKRPSIALLLALISASSYFH